MSSACFGNKRVAVCAGIEAADLTIILLLRSQLSSGMSVTLPIPRVTLLRRPAHSGWLQVVVTGIGLQRPVYSSTTALAVVQPAECKR